MYNGNPSLRKAGENIEYTEDILNEYVKCKEDIIYFAEKYFSIVTIDHGKQLIKLFDFQKKILKIFVSPPDERNHAILRLPRQYGKTSLMTIFLLHYALFNKDKTIAVLAHQEKLSIEILDKIKMAFKNLPMWLQVGIVEGGWNQKSLILENGSRIYAFATGSESVTGFTINCITDNNKVTVKKTNKSTDIISELSIKQLKKKLNGNVKIKQKDSTIIFNDNFEILTPNGFKDFDGLLCSKKQKILKIELENKLYVECTYDQLIYKTNKKKIEAQKLKINDKIQTKFGIFKISKISKLNKEKPVYDILNVKDNHKFYCNDILISNCLFLDEFAKVPQHVAEEFISSTYPVISSGKSSKIIMCSSPKGMNLFYEFWIKAVRHENNFYPIRVGWWEWPNRDNSWKQKIIADIGERRFSQEYQCVRSCSKINIKNKKTNEIRKIQIKDLLNEEYK